MADNNNGKRNRVVLVGHCGADTGMLQNAVENLGSDIEVEISHDQSSTERYAKEGSVLLINRVLDGSFNASNGVELIRDLRSKADQSQFILISNYPEAQQEAEEAGAAPGFGKGEVRSDRFKSRMLAALGRDK